MRFVSLRAENAKNIPVAHLQEADQKPTPFTREIFEDFIESIEDPLYE